MQICFRVLYELGPKESDSSCRQQLENTTGTPLPLRFVCWYCSQYSRFLGLVCSLLEGSVAARDAKSWILDTAVSFDVDINSGVFKKRQSKQLKKGFSIS